MTGGELSSAHHACLSKVFPIRGSLLSESVERQATARRRSAGRPRTELKICLRPSDALVSALPMWSRSPSPRLPDMAHRLATPFGGLMMASPGR